MVNSTTPRFEERCPGFFETTSTMNSRISAASFGRSASLSFFKSSGYSTQSNNLLIFHYLFKPRNLSTIKSCFILHYHSVQDCYQNPLHEGRHFHSSPGFESS